MHWMAHVVGLILDRLGHERADVLGYSWGGTLAQQFAFQNPHRCRSVVLACTTPGMMALPGRPSALSRMVTPRRHRDPRYAEQIAGTVYGGTARTQPSLAGQTLGRHTRAGSSRGYLYQLLAGLWTSTPLLPMIRQRTLVIAGDDDPIIPITNGKILATLMPHAQLHIFAGGHLGLVTEAATLGPLIDRFLDGAKSAKS